MEYVLETNGLCKRYRGFTALNGLNMHIPKGAIYGFVGRNGAGKTTLIRLICGLQAPTDGSFSLYGVKHTDAGIQRCRQRCFVVLAASGNELPLVVISTVKNAVHWSSSDNPIWYCKYLKGCTHCNPPRHN